MRLEHIAILFILFGATIAIPGAKKGCKGSTSPPTDSCANCRRSSIKVSQDGPAVNLSKVTVGPYGCFDITAACRPNVPIFLVVNGNETLLNSAVFECSNGNWIYTGKQNEMDPVQNVPIKELRCYLAE